MTNSLSERFFDFDLWLVGAAHFVILFASFQVPYRLGWKQDLRQLMPFNRKLLWVQSGFTVFTIIAFGTLTLVFFVLAASYLGLFVWRVWLRPE